MHIGIVFGCFIPLHEGHLKIIDIAKKQNNKIILALCGSDDDRGKDFIPFSERYTLLTEKYCDDDRVQIVVIDDKKLGLTGKFDLPSWKKWCDELFAQANINPRDGLNEFTWYMGEESYAQKIKVLYREHHDFVVLNRNVINISGTEIRNNLEAYKDYVDPIFYKYLYEHGFVNLNQMTVSMAYEVAKELMYSDKLTYEEKEALRILISLPNNSGPMG